MDERRESRGAIPPPSVVALVAAGILVVVAIGLGAVLLALEVPLRVRTPPLFADVRPRLTPWSALALLVAVATVAYGPSVAQRLPWRGLLPVTWASSLAWTASLAMVRGWDVGVRGRLTTGVEYVSAVRDAPPVGELLSTFVARIPVTAPEPWVTHVAGHPPGALLLFVGLDDLGLRGGSWAGVVSMVAAASVPVAVLVAARRLASESWARRTAPFAVLVPAVIWTGVSADAVFAAVTAWGLVLVVLASRASQPSALGLGLAGGLVLGAAVMLSYGLVLTGLPVLAVLAARRAWGAVAAAVTGGLVVVLAMWALGFAWWEGLAAVRGRYLAGYGGMRPYAYFVWANLAAAALAVGPAVVAALPLALRRPTVPRGVRTALVGLLGAVAVADLSGMSKAEVERIWLPWLLWLPLACPALPRGRDRAWLASSAALALALEHVLLMPW